MFVHTLPKSGINGRSLVSRAMHGLVPLRPTPPDTESWRDCRLAYPFGVYRSWGMAWGGTGGYRSHRDSVLWRTNNPYSSNSPQIIVDLPAPWAAPIPWIPTVGCNATIVIESWKDVGSSWESESIGTSFGPRNASARLNAHITEFGFVIFDNPSELTADRLTWNWQSNTDKVPLGRVHTMVFVARGGVREIWIGGVKVADKTGANDYYWNEGSANGWHWYASSFSGAYSVANPYVGHGACGYWNYALTERECRVLSMGFRNLYEGLPRSLGLPTPQYELASLNVRARRVP